MRDLTVDSRHPISLAWWRKVTQSASSRSKPGYRSVKSVFLSKFYPLLKDGLEEVVATGFFLLQPLWGNRYQCKWRTRPYIPHDMTEPCSGGKLLFGTFAHQAQVNIAVGACLAAGVRTKEVYCLQGHYTIKRLQTFAEGISLITEAWRQIFKHKFHADNYSPNIKEKQYKENI